MNSQKQMPQKGQKNLKQTTIQQRQPEGILPLLSESGQELIDLMKYSHLKILQALKIPPERFSKSKKDTINL